MRRTSTSLKASWRQLPFIILGGLLIGFIFGEALKAFVPGPSAVATQGKSRPSGAN